MILAPPLESVFASLGYLRSSVAAMLAPVIRAARDLSVHLVEGARNIFRDVRDFDIAEDVFEFRGNTVASGDRFAERDCFANHFEIGPAGSTELQVGR